MNSDRAVVDSSIAMKWLFSEADSAQAEALLLEWVDRGVVVLAPPLLAYEVANGIHQHVRRGEVALDDVPNLLIKLHSIGLILDNPVNAGLSTLAIRLAHQFGLGPAYDTQFLALAELQDCEYWTADHNFWMTIHAVYSRVRWLGDLAATGNQP